MLLFSSHEEHEGHEGGEDKEGFYFFLFQVEKMFR
jgi:hypothetical protein